MNLRYRDDPVLHRSATPVHEREDVWPIIDIMFETMYQRRGIGLAGPQIGTSKRIIVIHALGLKQEFINPAITKRYGGKMTSREGCLSFPGETAVLTRDKQIIVEGFDRNWKPIRRKLKGLQACCVQHEVDHLNGITIL